MAGVRIPHVINYKDFLYYDDETEYLKRFYKREEVKTRMGNITSFYFNLTEGNVRINFPLHDQFIIIQKRNEQHAKLILSKLQNFTEAPQTQREANINPNEDALRNIQEGPKLGLVDQQEKKPSNEVEKTPQKIITLKTSEEQIEKRSENKEQEDQINMGYQNILLNQEDLEVSFESIAHDIYYPAFSIEIPSKEPSTEDIINKKAVFNRRKDFKGDGFLENPAVPIISGAQIKKMQKALLQAEAEEGDPPIIEGSAMEVSPYAKIFHDQPLMIFKGNKNDLRGGVKESSKEKPKEPEKKIEYSLTNSVSFSKKEIFSNSPPLNNSETKVPKQLISNSIKEIEKENEGVFNDKQIAGNLLLPQSGGTNESRPALVIEKKKEIQEVKEEVVIREPEPVSTQVHFSDEKPSKLPMITIKNIQINQIHPQISKVGYQSEEVQQVKVDYEQNNKTSHFMQTIQTETKTTVENQASPEFKPSPELKTSPEAKSSHDGQNSSDSKPSPEIQAKPAETIFSEESSEHGTKATDTTPKTSSEYVKELMKKHYKLSDGGVSLSQPITERFKESSILARLTEAKKKVQEQHQTQQNSRNMLKNTSLRTSFNQDTPNSLKGRSNTEANIFQNIAVAKSLHMPHTSLWNYNPQPAPRLTNSPSSNTKRRLKSNEGVLLTQESSTSNPMSSRRSPENAKSISEFQGIEMLQNLNRNFDAVRMLDQKKAEYKHHNKSKSSSNYLQNKGSLKINPTIELDHFPGETLSSSRSQQNNYMSPYGSNKFNLKLDLGYISPNGKIDTNLGFLSSRSRNAMEKDSRIYAGKSPTERYATQTNKDYFLIQKYNKTEESQGYTKTDESRSKTRDLTGSISTLGHITDRNIKQQSPRGQGSMNKAYKNTGVNYPGQNNVYIADTKPLHKKVPNSSRAGSISYQNKQQILNKKGGKY